MREDYFKRDRPEAAIMAIDPEMARRLLETDTENRRKRGWYVDLLAETMKRKEWRVSSQGIGIDTNGNLIDGQHRLSACVSSGLPLVTTVVMGLRRDVYEIVDTGLKRNTADLLGESRYVAEIVRLAAEIVIGSKPTIDQMRPLMDGGIYPVAKALQEYCGSKAKIYSSAPVKLAACVSIMAGESQKYVFRQYRALLLQDFPAMEVITQAFTRQATSGKIKATDKRELFCRAMKVFDSRKRSATKIPVDAEAIAESYAFARVVLNKSVIAPFVMKEDYFD